MKSPSPPRIRRRPVRSRIHGIARTDDYAWLRAENWQEVMRDPSVLDKDIRSCLEAENAFMTAQMADTESLREELYQEMKGRIREDDFSPPARDGAFAYFIRYREGGQHPLFCRVSASDSEVSNGETLLDGDALAEGRAYFQLAAARHSPDHAKLAYVFDDRGSEFNTLKIRDLETGRDLEDTIPDTSSGGVWSADSHSLFYSRLDANHRPSDIYRHRLGTKTSTDVRIYSEADPGFFCGVDTTQSGRFVIIDSHDHETSEIHLLERGSNHEQLVMVAGRQTGVEYSVEHRGEELFILTNADGAEDFKIVRAPLSAPGREHWRDFIAHVPGRLILSFAVFADYLVRLEREDGLPRIVILHFDSGEEHRIEFSEEAYSLGFSAGYEFRTEWLRFTYSSMTTPAETWDYNMRSRERILRKRQEIPSGHDPADYVTRRLFAPAPDGETIPVSLLYRRHTPLDGSAPLLLYGYGAYGISIPAAFSGNRLSLADRGFVYAIAHVRGGKDKGYGWYRQGKLKSKKNTFSDFIAAGEYLASEKYTSRGRIIAHGGSAGGMLMGAVANMAPDLFGGIIADVPFVDVLTTMLDDTLPLTPPEWPEWGNPITDKSAYDYIASYSPYDNVTAQDYPPMLVLAGLTDPRVTYWEPAKWVAKLRALKTDNHVLLLKTHMEAGHGGAAGRFDHLKEVALSYAFALKVSGFHAA